MLKAEWDLARWHVFDRRKHLSRWRVEWGAWDTVCAFARFSFQHWEEESIY